MAQVGGGCRLLCSQYSTVSLDFVAALQLVSWHLPDEGNVTAYANKRRRELFRISGQIFRETTPLEGQ